MKKQIVPLLLALAFFSCSQAEESIKEPNLSDSESVFSNVRTVDDAIQIAKMAVIDETSKSRSARTVESVKTVVNHASRGESDTLFYAINYADGQGFALISAAKHLEPLLALVDKGSYDDAQNANNDGVQMVMGQIMEYTQIPNEIKEPIEIIPVPEPDTTFARPKTEPLVKVQWGQDWPEGALCFNGVAGCGPVAIAQVMTVMGLPKVINYTYPEKTIESESIDWEALKGHKHSRSFINDDIWIGNHLDNCDLPLNGHHTISRIVRQINYMTVFNNSSFSTLDISLSALKSLTGKSPIRQGSSMTALYNSICNSNDRLALVKARRESDAVSHCFIADAIWEVGMIIRRYHVVQEWDPNKPNTGITYTDYGSISKYVHLNWGDNGYCDGYFLYNLFDQSKAYEYDDEYHLFPETGDFSVGLEFATFEVKRYILNM